MHCVSLQPPFTAGRLLIERASINESPVYQRESGVWSVAKRQLFIDSILNGYDIPKLYFHDLRSDGSIHYEFAVVDGKQRLHALWDFLESKLPLGDNIAALPGPKMSSKNPPREGQRFSEMDLYWQERIKGCVLPIIVIQEADEDDIEELFSRLNNGEPLTGAEKRNAMGGQMCSLIRKIAQGDFFGDWANFSNKRLQYHEAAAKFLIMESTIQSGGELYCDLKKRFLDAMVENGKRLPEAAIEGLSKSVVDNLNGMKRIFDRGDPLLRKPTFVPLYYAFCRKMRERYAHPRLNSKIHNFLESFQVRRQENLEKTEDDRDSTISEFGRLMQQGNDKESMRERVKILMHYFLQENPDVALKDGARSFSDEEKYAIWIIGSKICAMCKKTISLDDMEADHTEQHAHGGQTVLKNARSLCISCNRKLNAKVA